MNSRILRHATNSVALLAFLVLGSGCDFGSGRDKVARENLDVENTAPVNVLWIVLDALRARNLSVYGYDRTTSPRIDQFAQRGVVFERHYSQQTHTIPSVPQYLSGRYYPVSGFALPGWRSNWQKRPESEKYLSEILSAVGYDTVIFTPHPFFTPDSRVSSTFDEFLFSWPEGRPTASVGGAPVLSFDRPVAFVHLREQFEAWIQERTGDDPFFAYIHAIDTHFPHYPTPYHEEWLNAIPGATEQMVEDLISARMEANKRFTPLEQEVLRALYDGSIRYVDQEIGRLIDGLEASGLLRNTLVIISSDHGETLGEDGVTVQHPGGVSTDELLHIPLILVGPGLPGSTRVANVTENVDIVPTVLEILGVETRATFDGDSMIPLMMGHFEGHEDLALALFPLAQQPGQVAINQERKAVLTGEGQPPLLFRVPDLLGSRIDLTESEVEVAHRMATQMTTILVPLAQNRSAQPFTEKRPFRMDIPVDSAQPRSAWRNPTEGHWTDGKWALAANYLAGMPALEHLPEIQLEFDLPNEKFLVQMELVTHTNPSQAIGGFLGSSFLVRADDQDEFTRVEYVADRRASKFVDIGVYQVTDGRLTITLRPGDENLYAYATSFRFIPDGFGSEQLEDSTQLRLEQLEALGYL